MCHPMIAVCIDKPIGNYSILQVMKLKMLLDFNVRVVYVAGYFIHGHC